MNNNLCDGNESSDSDVCILEEKENGRGAKPGLLKDSWLASKVKGKKSTKVKRLVKNSKKEISKSGASKKKDGEKKENGEKYHAQPNPCSSQDGVDEVEFISILSNPKQSMENGPLFTVSTSLSSPKISKKNEPLAEASRSLSSPKLNRKNETLAKSLSNPNLSRKSEGVAKVSTSLSSPKQSRKNETLAKKLSNPNIGRKNEPLAKESTSLSSPKLSRKNEPLAKVSTSLWSPNPSRKNETLAKTLSNPNLSRKNEPLAKESTSLSSPKLSRKNDPLAKVSTSLSSPNPSRKNETLAKSLSNPNLSRKNEPLVKESTSLSSPNLSRKNERMVKVSTSVSSPKLSGKMEPLTKVSTSLPNPKLSGKKEPLAKTSTIKESIGNLSSLIHSVIGKAVLCKPENSSIESLQLPTISTADKSSTGAKACIAIGKNVPVSKSNDDSAVEGKKGDLSCIRPKKIKTVESDCEMVASGQVSVKQNAKVVVSSNEERRGKSKSKLHVRGIGVNVKVPVVKGSPWLSLINVKANARTESLTKSTSSSANINLTSSNKVLKSTTKVNSVVASVNNNGNAGITLKEEKTGPRGKGVHTCIICGKCFKEFSFLKKHLLTHAYKEDSCDKKSASSSDLVRNKKSEVLDSHQKATVCLSRVEVPLAKKSPDSLVNLKAQKGKKQQANQQVRATNCSSNQENIQDTNPSHTGVKVMIKSTTSLTTANNIPNQNNSSGQSFACPICKKSLSKDSLQSHMLIHSREKSHQCQVCGHKFRLKKSLKKHILKHSNGNANSINNVSVSKDYNAISHSASGIADTLRVGGASVDSPVLQSVTNVTVPKDMTTANVTVPKDMTTANVTVPKDMTTANVTVPKDMTTANVTVPKDMTTANVTVPKDMTTATSTGLVTFESASVPSKGTSVNLRILQSGFHVNILKNMNATSSDISMVSENFGTSKGVGALHSLVSSTSSAISPDLTDSATPENMMLAGTSGNSIFQSMPPKPYSCPICYKGLSKSYVKTHMRIHTGDRPFMCSICGSAFISKQSLKKHTFKVHAGAESADNLSGDLAQPLNGDVLDDNLLKSVVENLLFSSNVSHQTSLNTSINPENTLKTLIYERSNDQRPKTKLPGTVSLKRDPGDGSVVNKKSDDNVPSTSKTSRQDLIKKTQGTQDDVEIVIEKVVLRKDGGSSRTSNLGTAVAAQDIKKLDRVSVDEGKPNKIVQLGEDQNASKVGKGNLMKENEKSERNNNKLSLKQKNHDGVSRLGCQTSDTPTPTKELEPKLSTCGISKPSNFQNSSDDVSKVNAIKKSDGHVSSNSETAHQDGIKESTGSKTPAVQDDVEIVIERILTCKDGDGSKTGKLVTTVAAQKKRKADSLSLDEGRPNKIVKFGKGQTPRRDGKGNLLKEKDKVERNNDKLSAKQNNCDRMLRLDCQTVDDATKELQLNPKLTPCTISKPSSLQNGSDDVSKIDISKNKRVKIKAKEMDAVSEKITAAVDVPTDKDSTVAKSKEGAVRLKRSLSKLVSNAADRLTKKKVSGKSETKKVCEKSVTEKVCGKSMADGILNQKKDNSGNSESGSLKNADNSPGEGPSVASDDSCRPKGGKEKIKKDLKIPVVNNVAQGSDMEIECITKASVASLGSRQKASVSSNSTDSVNSLTSIQNEEAGSGHSEKSQCDTNKNSLENPKKNVFKLLKCHDKNRQLLLCKICDRQFLFSLGLEQHMKKKHSNKMT